MNTLRKLFAILAGYSAILGFGTTPVLGQNSCDPNNIYDRAHARIVAEYGGRNLRECQTGPVYCGQIPNQSVFGPANRQKYSREVLEWVPMSCQIAAETNNSHDGYRRCGGSEMADRIIIAGLVEVMIQCQVCPSIEFDFEGVAELHALTASETGALTQCNFLPDPSEQGCDSTMNVADRDFEFEGLPYSCRSAERNRAEVYNRLTTLLGHHAPLMTQRRELVETLDRYEQLLADAVESRDWAEVSLVASEVSVLLTTVGAIVCIETAGAGCAVSAAGALMIEAIAITATISGRPSIGQIQELRNAATETRVAIRWMDKQQVAPMNEAIARANRMCEAIKEQCL